MLVRGLLVCAALGLLASGCARNDRDALYQPMEENYAAPADPIRQQVEDDPLLDNRDRVATEQRTAPEELRRSEDEDDIDPR